MEVELQPKQNLHWDKGRPLSLSTDEPLRREAHASPWPIQPESPGLRQQEEPGFRSVRSVFIPIPKKGEAQERSNHRTIALTSHTSKGTLKTLQARLQQYVNRELADVQAGFRKDRGTRDQIANIRWIIEKATEFQKSIYFFFIDYAKAFDCVDPINCGKFWKTWDSWTTWPASWETSIKVRKQQLELDLEHRIGSK